MAFQVYLFFNGNCREAVEFYARAFDAKEPVLMTYGDSHQYDEGAELPSKANNLIMHAHLNVKGSQMMFSDVFPGTPYVVGTNMSIAFVDSDIDYMKAAFGKLKEDGHVELELQETFFSKCYGILTDKFGTRWQFSHQEE